MGKQPKAFKVYIVVPPNARDPWVRIWDPSEKEAPPCFSLGHGT